MIFIGQTYVRSSAYLGRAAGFFHIPEISYLLPLTCVVLVVVGFFIYRVDRSRVGRAIDTISVNPDLASSLGIDVPRVRLLCQTASGALGALAGVLYAFTIGAITPAAFGLSIVLSVFVFIFVGGSQTMWGAVVFAPILWGFAIFIPEEIGKYKDVIYGILLIAILIVRPEGALDKKAVRTIWNGFVDPFRRRSISLNKSKRQVGQAGVSDSLSETED
jgi:branched-chain amino acid transport system permease protein